MAMTKDEIIEIAKEAGFARTKMHKALERFAELIAAAEREACALILDNCEMERTYTHEMAKMIRARGNNGL